MAVVSQDRCHCTSYYNQKVLLWARLINFSYSDTHLACQVGQVLSHVTQNVSCQFDRQLRRN